MKKKLEELRRYLLTIAINVHPTGTKFPAATSVDFIWFGGKWKANVDNFLTPATDHGDVDLGYIIEKVPYVHKIHIHRDNMLVPRSIAIR